MKRKPLKDLKRVLKSAKTALVAAHIDPDGDTLGSMLALGKILEALKKKVSYYCEDKVPHVYDFLPDVSRVRNEIPEGARYDLFVATDAADLCRLGEKIDPRTLAKHTVNIDHHPDNSRWGDINYVENISSVAELVYQAAKYLKVKISKEIAQCLYLAIITDTGNFRYELTSPQTFKIAAELLKCGVNQAQLTNNIYDQRRLSSILITSRALSGVKTSSDGRVGWTAVTRKMMESVGAEGEDLMGLVDQIRSLAGVEVAILFREWRENKVKVNFRSKEKTDVSQIAHRFGGGGHPRAAGAVVVGEIDKVQEQVVKETLKSI